MREAFAHPLVQDVGFTSIVKPQLSNIALVAADRRNVRYWIVPGLALTVAATG
jgi:hypothetical protein